MRFPRRLSDERRIQALSELNASIEESRLPAALRCAGFERYARSLPFASGNDAALREIVRRSLAREQHWRGADCSVVNPPSSP